MIADSDRRSPVTGYNRAYDRVDPIQRETIRLAFERRYFEIPRRVSMQELADELDVTPNAVSERLRRAKARPLSTLLSHTVPPDRS